MSKVLDLLREAGAVITDSHFVLTSGKHTGIYINKDALYPHTVATSLVCRAATPETRAHVPYNIVLVDTTEGFRMMAHGDNDLAIGDRVTVRFVPFAGRLVPYFTK